MTDTVSTAHEPSKTVTVLVNVPYAAGWNVTVMEHVAPAARLTPQLFLCVNDGSPLREIPAIPAAALLVFETVTALLGLSS